MLKELSLRDSEWRKIALKICGCKHLADDLVNDMYIKFHNSPPKYITTSYVSYAIYHLFLNYNKKKKITKSIEDCYIDVKCEDDDLNLRLKMDEALNELSFVDREILLHTHERSLRKNVEHLNITIRTLQHSKGIALEKLKETKTIQNIIKERWQEENQKV